MIVDLHVHTNLSSDSNVAPEQYLQFAAASGRRLDAICFTEHRLFPVDAECEEKYRALAEQGWSLYKLKRYKDYLEVFQKSVRLLDEKKLWEPLIYEHMGDVYSAMDDRKRALSSWKKSLDLDPSNKKLRKKVEGMKK